MALNDSNIASRNCSFFFFRWFFACASSKIVFLFPLIQYANPCVDTKAASVANAWDVAGVGTAPADVPERAPAADDEEGEEAGEEEEAVSSFTSAEVLWWWCWLRRSTAPPSPLPPPPLPVARTCLSFAKILSRCPTKTGASRKTTSKNAAIWSAPVSVDVEDKSAESAARRSSASSANCAGVAAETASLPASSAAPNNSAAENFFTDDGCCWWWLVWWWLFSR